MTLALIAFHLAVLLAAAALLVTGALHDARHYKIPNAVSVALLVLFPVYVLTSPHGVDWVMNIAVFALVLAASFGMYSAKLAGAGDAKLLATVGLWAGPHYVGLFLIVTALAGGVLALFMTAIVTLRRHQEKDPVALTGDSLSKVAIPYGLAIATGGLAVLLQLAQPLLFPG